MSFVDHHELPPHHHIYTYLRSQSGPYLRQGKEGDCPRPQKISSKFGPQIFFRGLLGPKKIA